MEVPYSFAPAYMNRQRAAVVGSLGICYYREGKFETAAEHKPDYLRISQAERERAEKEKNAKAGSPWYDDRRWCGGSRDGASEFFRCVE